MYARKQLLIWTAVIFVLNIVLLAKLRDDSATARTQLEELTPTELTQIDLTNLLESNSVTYSEQATEAISHEDQFSEAKTEESNKSSQFSSHPENISAGSVEVYYVHKGDTLWKISRRHNLDLRALLAYNKLKNPNLIRPGQRIEIPHRHINMQVSP
ncbi:LysM peptidoglycan-binding domain-containing protein [Candidatus Poribacteria bacterium]|nr:LysM peptidoglycan-binding domain-containing protein [Candidatus Poribacteria bacterium]